MRSPDRPCVIPCQPTCWKLGRQPTLWSTGGCLCAWGGRLATYGITHPRKGRPVTGSIHFLEGLLPLDDSPLYLPCGETPSGAFADIHIFPGDERDWVLLLDATGDEVQRRLLQQKANEFSLLQERQAKRFGHDAGADVAANPVQVAHTALTNISLEEKHAIIQKARENSLASDLVEKDIPKKEVLLHRSWISLPLSLERSEPIPPTLPRHPTR